jgi:hypothetical protein
MERSVRLLLTLLVLLGGFAAGPAQAGSHARSGNGVEQVQPLQAGGAQAIAGASQTHREAARPSRAERAHGLVPAQQVANSPAVQASDRALE